MRTLASVALLLASAAPAQTIPPYNVAIENRTTTATVLDFGGRPTLFLIGKLQPTIGAGAMVMFCPPTGLTEIALRVAGLAVLDTRPCAPGSTAVLKQIGRLPSALDVSVTIGPAGYSLLAPVTRDVTRLSWILFPSIPESWNGWGFQWKSGSPCIAPFDNTPEWAVLALDVELR